MLTPGNAKLGTDLIWGFGLPSGGAVCVGMTKTCKSACYAIRTEQYRPNAAKRYRRNLELTKAKGFVRRMRAFLIAHYVRVVRIHTGGEFFSPLYVRQWRRIIERSPKVRFFTYTRAWRVDTIREELERLASLPNLQLWYSADRETGLPDRVPPRVRVAWLATESDEGPPTASQDAKPGIKHSIKPQEAELGNNPPDAEHGIWHDIKPQGEADRGARIDLVFRVRRLRKESMSEWNGIPVCPAEAGEPGPKPTCDRCRTCWKPPRTDEAGLPNTASRIVHLPVLSTTQ